jgi:hypothetical protein
VGEPNLTEGAWDRAVRAASGNYRTTAFGVTTTLATIILGAVAAVLAAGKTVTAQIAVPIIGGAVAVALCFGLLFLFELIVAPVRQRDELRRSWSTGSEDVVNVEVELRNLYRKGDEQMVRFDARTGHTRSQGKAAEEWADQVVTLMTGRLPEDKIRRFLAAGNGVPGSGRRLREQLDSLRSIIAESYPDA